MMKNRQAKDKLELLQDYRSLLKFYGGDYDMSQAVLTMDLLDEVDAEIDFYREQSVDIVSDILAISCN